MSATTHGGHAAPDAHEEHANEAPHGTLQGYLTGFVLSVILTAIPFWLVMAHVFKSPTATALTVMALAGAQIVVHMVYFLHMTPKAEGGWNMLALIFTLVLVTIALSGSMWVMYHLNNNMMPSSPMAGGNAMGASGVSDMGSGDMSGMKAPPPTSARDPRTMP